MRNSLYLLLLVFTFNCGQEKKPLLGETEFQRKMNADFKDASKSPLKDSDRRHFESLDFFKFDSTYVVTAILKQTPDTDFFDMQTTTSRVSKERIFGVVSFELKGKKQELNVYQGQEHTITDGFKDYLFLPFLDHTNGESSYGGGRYIDLRIPEGDTLIIDFNTAYNPYCVYNEKYSCPLVPRENYIGQEVEAGIKIFKTD